MHKRIDYGGKVKHLSFIPDELITLARRDDFVQWLAGVDLPLHDRCNCAAVWVTNNQQELTEAEWRAIIEHDASNLTDTANDSDG